MTGASLGGGDQKILKDMLVEWEMEQSSSVTTPYVKEEGGQAGEGGESVVNPDDSARVTRFRRAAAKLNYLALDDPRISFASKQISQVMSAPTIEG